MDRVVGIGEYIISCDEKDVIKTFALASCVAVTIYSPSKKVLGMVHIALPSSDIDTEKSILSPGYFVDTAVPALIREICSNYKCNKDELVVNVYGGAQSQHQNDYFKIGERNIKEVECHLKKHDLSYNINETGGYYSRTLVADVATGTVKLNMHPMTNIRG